MTHFLVLRRASENRWQTVGPYGEAVPENKAHADANSFAKNFSEEVFAVAKIEMTYSSQKEVVKRPANQSPKLKEVS